MGWDIAHTYLAEILHGATLQAFRVSSQMMTLAGGRAMMMMARIVVLHSLCCCVDLYRLRES